MTEEEKEGYKRNFDKCTKRGCKKLRSQYDYGSVMHYPRKICVVDRRGEEICKKDN